MSGRLEFDLSGCHWKMEGIRPGGGVAEGFPGLPAEFQGAYFSWNQATVPGDVYTDLWRAGEIDDPLYGRNLHKAKWIQEREYWYTTRFDLPDEMQGQLLRLVFEGVDYACEVWLNGHYLGAHEGMYSAFEFDITRLARLDPSKGGSNILMVRLDPPPRNYQRVGGRKFCFQGDYLTGVVPFGLWRPVKLQATGLTRVADVRVETTLREPDAVVQFDVELHHHGTSPVDVMLRAVVTGETSPAEPIIITQTHRAVPGRSETRLETVLRNAQLWWPWDLGEQPLYRVEVTVEREGECLDQATETFGVRQIEMVRNPGLTDDEVESPWTVLINGQRHFLRSACWGGPPSFFYGRNSEEKYTSLLGAAREANVNNLRIFGWHPPEVPLFYDLCDRLGITVWTNFSFATQAFPSDPEFVDAAVRECVEIVKQRRCHPSQIFWMGGEEVFFSEAHVESGNRELMAAIGGAVAAVTSTPYGLASPLSGPHGQRLGFKPKESTHANGHYYAAGARFMEDYYPQLDSCVIPELTAASAPDVESLRRFIPPEELWPPGPTWGYRGADLDLLRILNLEVFGDERTGSLAEFVGATQQAQGIIFGFALEHFRRRKPRVSAVALCHFITHSPDIKWGIVDYYGRRKQSFEHVRRAYQPLLVSLEYAKRWWGEGEIFTADIWIVNDLRTKCEGGTLSWRVLDGRGKAVGDGHLEVDVPPDSSQPYAAVTWTVTGAGSFEAELQLTDRAGETLSASRYTFPIGDLAELKRRCLAARAEAQAKRATFGNTYTRYFPALQLPD